MQTSERIRCVATNFSYPRFGGAMHSSPARRHGAEPVRCTVSGFIFKPGHEDHCCGAWRGLARSRPSRAVFTSTTSIRGSKGISYGARFWQRIKMRLSRNRHHSFNVDCQCCQSDVGQKSPNRNNSGSGFFVFCLSTSLRSRSHPRPAGGALLDRNSVGLWRLLVGDLLCLGLTFSQVDHRSSFP